MTEVDWADFVPETTEQRRQAFLATVSIVGGGVLAYIVGNALRAEKAFDVELRPEDERPGWALVGGLALFSGAVYEAAQEYGWKPLVIGTVGISAVVGVARLLQR